MRHLLRYGGAVAAVGVATLITLLVAPWMGGSYAIFFFSAARAACTSARGAIIPPRPTGARITGIASC